MSEVKVKWIVFDNNNANDITVLNNLKELRYYTKYVLEDYYEAYSPAGNVVADMLEYVPDNTLASILRDFNYTVVEMNGEKLW